MTVHANEFMHLITFNKAERAQKLGLDTEGIVKMEFDERGDSLVFDVTGKAFNLEIASRQVVDGSRGIQVETSRFILRNHAEGLRRCTYEGTLKQALIVGIVANSRGEPVMTFEARKTLTGWQVFGKKYKYVVDTVL